VKGSHKSRQVDAQWCQRAHRPLIITPIVRPVSNGTIAKRRARARTRVGPVSAGMIAQRRERARHVLAARESLFSSGEADVRPVDSYGHGRFNPRGWQCSCLTESKESKDGW